MDKISGWELVAAFSLVGVLLIAILIVLLTLLLSNVVKNKIISNKGAKNWVKQTPSTYKKQPEHHQGNGNLTNSQELVNARGMNGDVVEFPKEDMRGRETDVRVKEEEKQKKLFFPLSNKGFFLKSYNTCGDTCVFVANEVRACVFEFDLVSIDRAQSWDISEAVINVGKVLQQDAVGFTCKKKGLIEQKEQNGITYWQIKEKLEVEYLK